MQDLKVLWACLQFAEEMRRAEPLITARWHMPLLTVVQDVKCLIVERVLAGGAGIVSQPDMLMSIGWNPPSPAEALHCLQRLLNHCSSMHALSP